MNDFNNLSQSDQKLKEAIAEIESIAAKYGIGAIVCLASSTHGEFGVYFPDWSLIQRVDEGKTAAYRLRMNSREHSQEQAEASLHLLYSLRDMAGLQFQNFEAVCRHVSSQIQVEHEPFSGLWDLDGWAPPDLPPSPSQVFDLRRSRRKRRPPKGFKKYQSGS